MRKKKRTASIILICLCCTAVLIISGIFLADHYNVQFRNWLAARMADMDAADQAGVSVDIPYVPVLDIQDATIREIPVTVNDSEWFVGKSVNLSDGGILLVNTLADDAEYQSFTARATRYSADGDMLWQVDYEDISGILNITGLIALPDDSFVFVAEGMDNYDNADMLGYIVRCGSDGQPMAGKELPVTGLYCQQMVLTGEGNILIAGQAYSDSPTADEHGGYDIQLVLMDADLNEISSRFVGSSQDDLILSASYDNEMGLCITGESNGTDGDFTVMDPDKEIYYVANFTDDLQLIFLRQIGDLCDLTQDNYTGTVLAAYNQTLLTTNNSVIALGSNGSPTWETSISADNILTEQLTDLGNGNILLTYRIYQGQETSDTYFSCLDKDGQLISTARNIPGKLDSLTVVGDGIFYACYDREVAALPDGSDYYTYDYESVICKYDSDLNIFWRKTYNRYTESSLIDFVIPRDANTVFIEKDGDGVS